MIYDNALTRAVYSTWRQPSPSRRCLAWGASVASALLAPESEHDEAGPPLCQRRQQTWATALPAPLIQQQQKLLRKRMRPGPAGVPFPAEQHGSGGRLPNGMARQPGQGSSDEKSQPQGPQAPAVAAVAPCPSSPPGPRSGHRLLPCRLRPMPPIACSRLAHRRQRERWQQCQELSLQPSS